MYEKFTDRARKAMQLANQQAQKFNHEYIGVEHVLLGMLKEGSGVACNVLKSLGIDLRRIVIAVEDQLKPGPNMITMGRLPQTPSTKKMIEKAIEYARELNHNYVGTEHLLMGLVTCGGGVADDVLRSLGVLATVVDINVKEILGWKPEGTKQIDNPGFCVDCNTVPASWTCTISDINSEPVVNYLRKAVQDIALPGYRFENITVTNNCDGSIGLKAKYIPRKDTNTAKDDGGKTSSNAAFAKVVLPDDAPFLTTEEYTMLGKSRHYKMQNSVKPEVVSDTAKLEEIQKLSDEKLEKLKAKLEEKFFGSEKSQGLLSQPAPKNEEKPIEMSFNKMLAACQGMMDEKPQDTTKTEDPTVEKKEETWRDREPLL